MDKQEEIAEQFRNKTILVTGHTGFIGTWMTLWLHMLGANVIGYSQKPLTNPSMFELIKIKKNITHIIGDVNNFPKLQNVIIKYKPKFVFHLAAQAIVRESYENPLETFQTNVIGTANILEAIKNSSVKSCIIMTSDKCYRNNEKGTAFKESDPLGGDDPYSASKGAAELLINAYQKSFFKNKKIGIASVRAGNVIGGGDWSQDRLVPDCFRSLESKKEIKIRNPNSVRPWQFVLEPINGMFQLSLRLIKNPKKYSEPWNFGPSKINKKITVKEMVKKIISQWKEGKYAYQSTEKYKEANILLLNSSKAKELLNWKQHYTYDETIFETVNWYQEFVDKKNMRDVSIQQIQKYMKNKQDD